MSVVHFVFFKQLGEPPVTASFLGSPSCNPHSNPPISGDCWYNCTLDDISGEDKRHRLHKVFCSINRLLTYMFSFIFKLLYLF